MFHDQHVSHKWHVFVFFMSCSEHPMGSFYVESSGSLIIFSALKVYEFSFKEGYFPTLEAGFGGCQHAT